MTSFDRAPKIKQQLIGRWSAKESDWWYWSPRSADGHLIHHMWSGHMSFPDFLSELERRGYDVKGTLRLTVRRKP